MLLIIAQVTQAPPPAPSAFAAVFPMLFLGTILGVILAMMARRKGRNPFLWFFIGLIPFAGAFAALVLASRPDVEWVRRIRALEDKLASLTPGASAQRPTEPSLDS